MYRKIYTFALLAFMEIYEYETWPVCWESFSIISYPISVITFA